MAEPGAEDKCFGGKAIACINTATTPRNIEGTALYVGDLFVKIQDRENALKAYNFAELAPDPSSWSFRPLLDERIKNIDSNLAAVETDTELDDPAWAWSTNSQCSYCHRR